MLPNRCVLYLFMRWIIFLSLHFLVFFILILSYAQAEEEWSIKAYDGYSYAAVSGEIQHGDKLIFILDPSDNCERVTNTFSFYTWEDPRDLKQLIDKDIPLKLNGKVGLTARVIAVNPILNGNHIILSLGAFPIKDYIGFLDEFYKKIKKYEIEIVDGLDFKAKKYFDITVNSWKLDYLIPSIQKANRICEQMRHQRI